MMQMAFRSYQFRENHNPGVRTRSQVPVQYRASTQRDFSQQDWHRQNGASFFSLVRWLLTLRKLHRPALLNFAGSFLNPDQQTDHQIGVLLNVKLHLKRLAASDARSGQKEASGC